MMNHLGLSVSGLTLAREGRLFAAVPDFAADPGQSVALVGASGSGKTTALMAMAGIRPPAAGTVKVKDVDPWTLSSGRRDRFRGQRIGLVFQTFHLVDAVSVQDNLALAASCAGLKLDRKRLDMLLKRLDLTSLRHRLPGTLSQGQAQRVAVARALINAPTVILADEPTSALDDGNTQALLGLLVEMARAFQAALIIVSHDARVKNAVDRLIAMEVRS